MKFVASGVSVIGPRHIELCEPNQDSMTLSGCRDGWIAVVADGLGSRTLSHIGSRGACHVVRQVLRTNTSVLDFSAALSSMHKKWLEAIRPVTPKDAATTLLFARVTSQGVVHAAQLGDGLILMRCGGQFCRITPERSGYANQTWALESELTFDKWDTTEGNFSQKGDGLVLLTDGVADDLEPDYLVDFFDTLYHNLSTRNRRRGKRWLQNELEDWATPMHSDDKSLVAIFRTSK